jgi:hypothetical protein
MEGQAMGQTLEDGGNRGLETRPIIPGPKPQDQMTVGTSITPQQKSFGKAIEIGLHKTVPPDPSVAPGTVGRPRPREKFSLLEKFLDIHIHLQQQ